MDSNFTNMLQQLVEANKEIMAELDRGVEAAQALGVSPEQIAKLNKGLAHLQEFTRLAQDMNTQLGRFD